MRNPGILVVFAGTCSHGNPGTMWYLLKHVQVGMIMSKSFCLIVMLQRVQQTNLHKGWDEGQLFQAVNQGQRSLLCPGHCQLGYSHQEILQTNASPIQSVSNSCGCSSFC